MRTCRAPPRSSRAATTSRSPPSARSSTDSIVRIASITKPITAAAVMLLVDDGRVALDDPIARWLPELASPRRRADAREPDRRRRAGRAARSRSRTSSPSAPAGASRPTSRCRRWSSSSRSCRCSASRETPDEWLATLARVPMLRQPGEAWLYNTCSDIQGVLVARVAGQPLPEFLAERIFEPLGMVDTGFYVPAEKLDRLPPYHGLDVDADRRQGSGRSRRSSRPAPAASSRRSPTGTASAACCSRTAAGSSRRSRCA